ncbi:unknown [Methanoculleus sp. CAG:1088]|nr:unknown [Methanoculleus sp. CAG:1088]
MPLGGESGAPRLTLSTCTGTVPAGGETIFAIIIKHRKHGFQITIKTNRVKIVIRLP